MVSGDHVKRDESTIKLPRALLTLAIILAAVFGLSFLLRTFVYQAYAIPSGSMETTIEVGDYVFAEKVSYYFSEPEVGDIVTFADPADATRTLIKRVVAVGGQTVRLVDGKVYVDGEPLDEPYANGKPSYPFTTSSVRFPYTVPEGYIWVMGDNRTNSQDSRYFGAIPLESVTGKAVWTIWPIDRFGAL